MTLIKSLKKIIKAHYTGQEDSFLSGIREIEVWLRRQDLHKDAEVLENDLRTALRARDIRRNNANVSPVPISKVDRLPLIDVIVPESTSNEVLVLNPSTSNHINQILQEQEKTPSLQGYGIQPSNKILFYGPPGCGKTMAARQIAQYLSWDLLYTRFDSVISSYLGETGTNLRQVFDYATQGKYVLFFDEFDAIGKGREGFEEVGEIKRVVNSFLQLMDNHLAEGILIAATNHEQLLDRALWRRFDEVIFFPMPQLSELTTFLTHRLSGIRLYDFTIEELVSKFLGLSYSDAGKVIIQSVKRMVLSDRSQITREDVIWALTYFDEYRPRERNP